VEREGGVITVIVIRAPSSSSSSFCMMTIFPQKAERGTVRTFQCPLRFNVRTFS
jgi:hypothetical protein